jgi:hypothetical protein
MSFVISFILHAIENQCLFSDIGVFFFYRL